MKKLFVWALGFFRSIFRKKHRVSVPEIAPEIKSVDPRATWRSLSEARSLLKQLRPGDIIFSKSGGSVVVRRILNHRKHGVEVKNKAGHRRRISFIQIRTRAFSPDLS